MISNCKKKQQIIRKGFNAIKTHYGDCEAYFIVTSVNNRK